MNNKILKICGIRDNLSNYDGIDLLGFNFIDISKRRIGIKKAKSIKTPDSVMRIGLFGEYDKENKLWKNLGEEELDEIVKKAKQANMKGVQIYGTSSFNKFKDAGFYTIYPNSYDKVENIILDKSIDLLIIDSKNPGSGKEYNYKKLSELKIKKPFLVAGGVDKNNILKIKKEVPNCIGFDIASGVDNGVNIDEKKIMEIVEEINK